MDRSAATVRIQEAIPTPLRIVGWILLVVPVLALLPDNLRGTLLVHSFIDEGLSSLRLGAGIAPLEFFAFAWLAVSLLFWAQAYFLGERLGPKSTVIFGTALAAQAILFVVTNAA